MSMGAVMADDFIEINKFAPAILNTIWITSRLICT